MGYRKEVEAEMAKVQTNIEKPDYQVLSNDNKASIASTSSIKMAEKPADFKLELNTNQGSQDVEELVLDATYTVQSGDTLSEIAQENNTTYQELAEYNGIADPSKIYVGQEIKIPGDLSNDSTSTTEVSDSAANASTSVETYVVQSGDTL